MTTLTRAVRRKVQTVRGEELVIVLATDGIHIRYPRKRTTFLLPYGAALVHAVELHVAKEKRDKAAARKQRKALQDMYWKR